MTWSLRLLNGDLVKGPGNSIETISGPDKVAQDLLCWIKEPYGTDPLNPSLGSFVDTGEEGTAFYANGQTVFLEDNYPDMVVSEVRRIVEGYRINQLARLRLELRQFNGLHTFSENEIVENFNIFYEQDVDTMFLTIQLEMVSGDYFSIDIPVATPSVPMS